MRIAHKLQFCQIFSLLIEEKRRTEPETITSDMTFAPKDPCFNIVRLHPWDQWRPEGSPFCWWWYRILGQGQWVFQLAPRVYYCSQGHTCVAMKIIRKQMRNSCLIKLSSITWDTFKHKHVTLFEIGRISLDYITDKLPLRKTFFYFPQFWSFMCFLLFFISEDVLFSIYLNIAFFPFSPANQRSNFLTWEVFFCFLFLIFFLFL